MPKKDIKKLDFWEMNPFRKYDELYIIPIKKNSEGYKEAYYIWKVWEEIKIIEVYDCWFATNIENIQWDFEWINWCIRLWSNSKKICFYHWTLSLN